MVGSKKCEKCGATHALTHYQIIGRIVCLACGTTQEYNRPGKTADNVGVVPGDRVWWRGSPRIPATPISRKLAAPETDAAQEATVPLSECYADQRQAIAWSASRGPLATEEDPS